MSDFKLVKVTKMSCTEGNSDKVYIVSLFRNDTTGEYKLMGENGRRGSSLTSQPKTIAGNPFDDFDKLVNSKVKGKSGSRYTIDSQQTANSATTAPTPKPVDVSFGFEVQLSNPITEAEAEEFINNPFWVMQQKFDGERRPVKFIADKGTQDFVGGNRKSEVITLPDGIISDLFKGGVMAGMAVDSEVVGDKLYIFDVMQYQGMDIRNNQLGKRLDYLEEIRRQAEAYGGYQNVVIAESWFTPAEKRRKFNELKLSGLEGVIFKPIISPYKAGRPSSGGDSLKCKFYEATTAKVIETNNGRSVAIGMLDENDVIVPVGNVTISADFSMPNVGDLVHVRYLYIMGPGGHLIQPVYKGLRTDKTAADKLSKLKIKPASQDLAELKAAA